MSEYDTVFSLPSVDEDPNVELGVLLMGLRPERLLAALGVAVSGRHPAEAPGAVLLVVDQLWHGVRAGLTFAAALAAGGERWRTDRPRLVAAAPAAETRTAALRRLWAVAAATVAAAGVADDGAESVYLTACWLRRAEIDELVAAGADRP